MKLSNIQFEDGKLIRDGDFDHLCLSNSNIQGKGLTFLEDSRFLEEIVNNNSISCVICLPEFETELPNKEGIYISFRPRLNYFRLHNYLCTMENYRLPDRPTEIGRNCQISNLAWIDKLNVIIGNNVVIEPFVSIYGHVEIGDNVIIGAGSVIGSQGFEYKREQNEVFRVTHVGRVVIENDVEILSGCTIHKAVYPWDKTFLGRYTKINSQVHIDHGVKIGQSALIGAGVRISGRVHVGNYVWIGPNAVLANRINIGDKAIISLGSVVTQDVAPNTRVTGTFAIDHVKWLEHMRTIR